ncbi:hypothetical protein FQA47_014762 [Oryzias melastigma]|uniref:Uncharacterized protein n=1 Tax=Oryzias melastigma TaxID=30732 RepID=A0A834C3M1_ORYME|nr:hypothetical protein FQA47_014762 [Oryzias melastigma]
MGSSTPKTPTPPPTGHLSPFLQRQIPSSRMKHLEMSKKFGGNDLEGSRKLAEARVGKRLLKTQSKRFSCWLRLIRGSFFAGGSNPSTSSKPLLHSS